MNYFSDQKTDDQGHQRFRFRNRYLCSRFLKILRYMVNLPIIVKIVNEKETIKPLLDPIHLTIKGDDLLNSDDIGNIKSTYNKLIFFKNANIIIFKKKLYTRSQKPIKELNVESFLLWMQKQKTIKKNKCSF